MSVNKKSGHPKHRQQIAKKLRLNPKPGFPFEVPKLCRIAHHFTGAPYSKPRRLFPFGRWCVLTARAHVPGTCPLPWDAATTTRHHHLSHREMSGCRGWRRRADDRASVSARLPRSCARGASHWWWSPRSAPWVAKH